LELVHVPAGEFLMGSDPAKDKNAAKNEQPQHRVYVSEFYIGKYPVTNEQYAAFVKATKHNPPIHWNNDQIPGGKENHPVVTVSWDDAVAFCEWLSQESGQAFRLPTEAEWEKAARGTDGRIYPWGDEWDSTRLNSWETGPRETTPVGKYSSGGDRPYGAADMAGNVWEWCADWYDEEEYQRRAKVGVQDPRGPSQGQFRVLRGGSWDGNQNFARCVCRGRGIPSGWRSPPFEALKH
jgi:formylglycine-generating enzyme required for sulfatase activity